MNVDVGKIVCPVASLIATLLVPLMTNPLAAQGGRPAAFGDEVAFLRQHVEVVVLHDPTNHAQVAIAPAWQGRVMTSTAGGDTAARASAGSTAP